MYRLVIVDDEKDIREHLKYLITASPISFQIMSEYENGIDAYEGITNDFPDLVITDIKIPYIDGIALAKNIKEIMPLVKIAFVTGYDEFDYAKQAANIGVVGFVSKPITQDNINEILKRAEDALNAEREVASSMGHLQAYYNKNISAIRSSDLYRLTNMSEVSTEFAEKLRLNGINLDFPFMTLAVVDFDKIYPESTDVNEFAYSLLEKLLSEEPSSCGVGQLFVDVFNRSEKICAIIKSNTKISSGGVERLFELFIARVKKFTNVSLSVGLSKTWQSTETTKYNFKAMYSQAMEALESRSVLGGNKVFLCSDNFKIGSIPLSIDDREIRDLGYSLKFKSKQECLNILSKIQEKMCGQEDASSYYYILSSILGVLIRACDNLDGLHKIYYSHNEIYKELFEKKTNDEIFLFFHEIIENISNLNDEVLVDTLDSNLEKITNFLDEHYTDADISFESLARGTCLSISYISSLLKKNLDTTFIKYITGKRIEKAKELLKQSGLRIVEVAEQVGYSDPYYFSHCFKKYTGISPKEYRGNE